MCAEQCKLTRTVNIFRLTVKRIGEIRGENYGLVIDLLPWGLVQLSCEEPKVLCAA